MAVHSAWAVLGTDHQRERQERRHAIELKRAHLQELLLHVRAVRARPRWCLWRKVATHTGGPWGNEGPARPKLQRITLNNLIRRNAAAEQAQTQPTAAACLQLPFILVRTDHDTHIDCVMTPNRNAYHFSLTAPFEIHDDIEVLRRMGLNRITPSELDGMITPEMRPFLPENVQLTADNADTLVAYEPTTPVATASASPPTSPLRGPYSSPPASMAGASSPMRSSYSPYPPSSSPAPSPHKAG